MSKAPGRSRSTPSRRPWTMLWRTPGMRPLVSGSSRCAGERAGPSVLRSSARWWSGSRGSSSPRFPCPGSGWVQSKRQPCRPAMRRTRGAEPGSAISGALPYPSSAPCPSSSATRRGQTGRARTRLVQALRGRPQNPWPRQKFEAEPVGLVVPSSLACPAAVARARRVQVPPGSRALRPRPESRQSSGRPRRGRGAAAARCGARGRAAPGLQ
mmetsp:Transcript_114615/g.307295  ORF Transcript_114615/g.307295 Transcript_114615/m.307295 type:complete len:212 (+) Transcript_114615:732-1367(+)